MSAFSAWQTAWRSPGQSRTHLLLAYRRALVTADLVQGLGELILREPADAQVERKCSCVAHGRPCRVAVVAANGGLGAPGPGFFFGAAPGLGGPESLCRIQKGAVMQRYSLVEGTPEVGDMSSGG